MDAFYGSLSSVSFTLLGLWWAVVSFRKSEWIADPARRRAAHAVTLSFLVPGAMALLSLVSGDQPAIWRWTFVIAGGLGAVAAALVVRALAADPTLGRVRLLIVTIAALDAVVAVAVALSGFPASIGLSLRPLQFEAILLALLVVAGASLAWVLFMEVAPPREP